VKPSLDGNCRRVAAVVNPSRHRDRVWDAPTVTEPREACRVGLALAGLCSADCAREDSAPRLACFCRRDGHDSRLNITPLWYG